MPSKTGHARNATVAIAFALAPGLVSAQEDEYVLLPAITLSAENIASREKSKSTIDRDTLDEIYSGEGLDTILQSIPGVTVQTGTGGDAELGINIRGLQDHGRVAVTIDGVRQNFARSGHGANGTFSVDSEMLREITVQRGPGGKPGAIGGSVEMRTVRASDLLADDGSPGGEFRLRYGTLSAAPTLHAAMATPLWGATDLTFASTIAEKDDYTAPDGTIVYARQRLVSTLFVLGATTQAGNRFEFSGSTLAQDYVLGRYSSTMRDTDLRQQTYTLNFELPDLGGSWQADGGIYLTTTTVSQIALDANFLPTGVRRSYQTGTTGLHFEADGAFDLGGRLHQVTVALEGFRDRVETTDGPGSLTPSGTREVWSLDIEDRIEFGAASLAFGVTLDSYELRSEGIRNSGQAISPRLSFNTSLGHGFHLSATAATTFRPPTLNETLVDGQHPPPATFYIRPNPNLQPEKAVSFELGVGYGRDSIFTNNDTFDLRVTAFHNTISDYIGLEEVGTIFNNYFQYQNIDKARIKGIELETAYESDRIFVTLSGQVMKGTDLSTGFDLPQVAPSRIVFTGGFRSADGDSTYGIRLTASGAKKDSASVTRTEAWQTVDLFFNHDISEQARFSLALNNLTNQTFTSHLQTQPQPGFNTRASLVFRF